MMGKIYFNSMPQTTKSIAVAPVGRKEILSQLARCPSLPSLGYGAAGGMT